MPWQPKKWAVCTLLYYIGGFSYLTPCSYSAQIPCMNRNLAAKIVDKTPTRIWLLCRNGFPSRKDLKLIATLYLCGLGTSSPLLLNTPFKDKEHIVTGEATVAQKMDWNVISPVQSSGYPRRPIYTSAYNSSQGDLGMWNWLLKANNFKSIGGEGGDKKNLT